MNGHGGKRAGAGKPRTPIDERRVLSLVAQKVPQRTIAERFGVPRHVIQYLLKTLQN
jgi:hypothetical protein